MELDNMEMKTTKYTFIGVNSVILHFYVLKTPRVNKKPYNIIHTKIWGIYDKLRVCPLVTTSKNPIPSSLYDMLNNGCQKALIK